MMPDQEANREAMITIILAGWAYFSDDALAESLKGLETTPEGERAVARCVVRGDSCIYATNAPSRIDNMQRLVNVLQETCSEDLLFVCHESHEIRRQIQNITRHSRAITRG
jgi:ABC-type thiamine transport system ATPase subunit